MKKISLKNLNLKEVEQLSRNQLKEVLGGNVGETNPVTEKKCSGPCGGYDKDLYYRSGECSISKITGLCICSSPYGTC